MSQAPVLEVRDVTVTFGGLRALSGVSLSVPPKGVVGLIGPNGAGKTTLFGVVSGLVRPRSGRVLLDGVDVTRASAQARARRGLARTFQRLELFGDLSVREHLVVAYRTRARRARLALDLVGLGRRPFPGEREEVAALLALLDLEEVADVPARSLPLGTGRLVEVARAVAARPRVLLLDEPSSGLDAEETARLTDVLVKLRAERGIALLVVEHNVEMVLGLAERVTVLDFGEVIAEGTPAEIRANPAVQAAYLGTVAS
jgi:ABC-type branched-subunit amino acid transport system ATPase component